MWHQQFGFRATPPGVGDLTAPQSGNRCHTHTEQSQRVDWGSHRESPLQQVFFFLHESAFSLATLAVVGHKQVCEKCPREVLCPSHLRHFCFLCSENKKAKTGCCHLLRVREDLDQRELGATNGVPPTLMHPPCIVSNENGCRQAFLCTTHTPRMEY